MEGDFQRAIMLGNNIALQWYAAIKGRTTLPGDAGGIAVSTPGGAFEASVGPGPLLLLLEPVEPTRPRYTTVNSGCDAPAHALGLIKRATFGHRQPAESIVGNGLKMRSLRLGFVPSRILTTR